MGPGSFVAPYLGDRSISVLEFFSVSFETQQRFFVPTIAKEPKKNAYKHDIFATKVKNYSVRKFFLRIKICGLSRNSFVQLYLVLARERRVTLFFLIPRSFIIFS